MRGTILVMATAFSDSRSPDRISTNFMALNELMKHVSVIKMSLCSYEERMVKFIEHMNRYGDFLLFQRVYCKCF